MEPSDLFLTPSNSETSLHTLASADEKAALAVPTSYWSLYRSFPRSVISLMNPLTNLAMALHSISLYSLTIPSDSLIVLTIYSALSLALYLSLSDSLRLFLISLRHPNRESNAPPRSMYVNSFSLWLSLESFFASNLKLLASLMAALILVQMLAFFSSNLSNPLHMRYLSYGSLIPSISSLLPYSLNHHQPPLTSLSLSSKYCLSFFLIYWWPSSLLRNNDFSIS